MGIKATPENTKVGDILIFVLNDYAIYKGARAKIVSDYGISKFNNWHMHCYGINWLDNSLKKDLGLTDNEDWYLINNRNEYVFEHEEVEVFCSTCSYCSLLFQKCNKTGKSIPDLKSSCQNFKNNVG